ncbi:major capsid protein [Comamonas sp. A7-5]|uniref:major capsid protein n=1 Tax=Comamonas sp. A7-5 TaxID=673549 RepID=UPI0031DC0CAE
MTRNALKQLAIKARGHGAKLAAGGVTLMLAAQNAMAQTAPAAPDVSAGEGFLMSLLTPIGILGSAYLIVTIAIRGWKIMRSV